MRILTITTMTGIRLRVVHRQAGGGGSHDERIEYYDARLDIAAAGTFTAAFLASIQAWPDEGQGLDVNPGQPGWRLDGATVTVIREWLAAAAPLTGLQPEHTLLPHVAGALITTDIADVRPGDIIFRGGHLVRRVVRAPARTSERDPDGGYQLEYPVTGLALPGAATSARTTTFLTPEGTSVLILRPATTTTTPESDASS